jgi:pimeloyl-ACP methyl ester carboxylesterase
MARVSDEDCAMGSRANVLISHLRGPMNYLKVPDASLYYEVTGSGPVLLMIPGGASDAGDFARIAPLLADTFTVVTVDPRGISRSRLEAHIADLSVEMFADDMHRLLAATSREPAYVFASSGGGQVGLALAARYPEQVRTLVVHEPPAVGLLPSDDQRRTGPQQIYDTYQEHGVGPAIQGFLALTGFGDGQEPGEPEQRGEPDPDTREAMAQRMASMKQNVEFFLGHYMLPVTAYVPDAPALQAASSRVVVGIGEASGGQLANDTALALADRLGSPAVVFPGDHSGFFTHPAAFARKLREVLDVA